MKSFGKCFLLEKKKQFIIIFHRNPQHCISENIFSFKRQLPTLLSVPLARYHIITSFNKIKCSIKKQQDRKLSEKIVKLNKFNTLLYSYNRFRKNKNTSHSLGNVRMMFFIHLYSSKEG